METPNADCYVIKSIWMMKKYRVLSIRWILDFVYENLIFVNVTLGPLDKHLHLRPTLVLNCNYWFDVSYIIGNLDVFAVSSDHVDTNGLLCCHTVMPEIYFISYIMQCTFTRYYYQSWTKEKEWKKWSFVSHRK